MTFNRDEEKGVPTIIPSQTLGIFMKIHIKSVNISWNDIGDEEKGVFMYVTFKKNYTAGVMTLPC